MRCCGWVPWVLDTSCCHNKYLQKEASNRHTAGLQVWRVECGPSALGLGRAMLSQALGRVPAPTFPTSRGTWFPAHGALLQLQLSTGHLKSGLPHSPVGPGVVRRSPMLRRAGARWTPPPNTG